MVSLTALWLPILLSGVIVFIASSILHMVLPFHRKDYKALPGEDDVRKTLRMQSIQPGNYAFPFAASPKEMGTPEVLEKYREGPVGLVNILPSGPPAMGKTLSLWFIYCVVLGLFVAYIASFTVSAGAEYMVVFRLTSTVAFLGFSGAVVSDSLWRGQTWSTTFKHIFDGLVYALLVAGVFSWLWPG